MHSSQMQKQEKRMPLMDFNLRHESDTWKPRALEVTCNPRKNNTDSMNIDLNVQLPKHKFKRSVQKYTKAIYLYKRSIRKPVLSLSDMSKEFEVD